MYKGIESGNVIPAYELARTEIPANVAHRNPPRYVGKFSGFRRTFQGRQEFLVVRLTRGGRGTGMGGGPRCRRGCCTGGGVFCCGRRRWWVCRVSTDFACLLQHLVYGVHVCPHGIKRHSNAKAHRTGWFVALRIARALGFERSIFSLWDLSSSSLFLFGDLINDKRWRAINDVAALANSTDEQIVAS